MANIYCKDCLKYRAYHFLCWVTMYSLVVVVHNIYLESNRVRTQDFEIHLLVHRLGDSIVCWYIIYRLGLICSLAHYIQSWRLNYIQSRRLNCSLVHYRYIDLENHLLVGTLYRRGDSIVRWYISSLISDCSMVYNSQMFNYVPYCGVCVLVEAWSFHWSYKQYWLEVRFLSFLLGQSGQKDLS